MIFSISTNLIKGAEIYSIYLRSNGMIEVSFNGGVLRTSTTALPLNTWTLVSVYISIFNKGTKFTTAAFIYFGKTLTHQYPSGSVFKESMIFDADLAIDIFMIGGVAGPRQGFEGSLSNLIIAYRSSPSINDGKCLLKTIFV